MQVSTREVAMSEHDDPQPDGTPLERLTRAVQAFINETDPDAPVLLDSAVVVWESMTYDDSGDLAYGVGYANAGRASMAATVGLLEAGKRQALDDIVAGVRPDDGYEP